MVIKNVINKHVTPRIPKKVKTVAEVIAHPHVRHKALFFTAYSVHLILEHTSQEATAGFFYYVIDVLHVFL